MAVPGPQAMRLLSRVAFRVFSLLKGKAGPTTALAMISAARAPGGGGAAAASSQQQREGGQGGPRAPAPGGGVLEADPRVAAALRDLICMIALQAKASERETDSAPLDLCRLESCLSPAS